MRRHYGLMGLAAAAAMLAVGIPTTPQYEVVRPTYRPEKKRQRPVNPRPNKAHRLKGLRP